MPSRHWRALGHAGKRLLLAGELFVLCGILSCANGGPFFPIPWYSYVSFVFGSFLSPFLVSCGLSLRRAIAAHRGVRAQLPVVAAAATPAAALRRTQTPADVAAAVPALTLTRSASWPPPVLVEINAADGRRRVLRAFPVGASPRAAHAGDAAPILSLPVRLPAGGASASPRKRRIGYTKWLSSSLRTPVRTNLSRYPGLWEQ